MSDVLTIDDRTDLENLRALCEFSYEQGFHEMGYDPVKSVETELIRLRTALGNISRMKGHPDKVVVLATLAAAISIATQALSHD